MKTMTVSNVRSICLSRGSGKTSNNSLVCGHISDLTSLTSRGTGRLPKEWALQFNHADIRYIVYSYHTPILWVDKDGVVTKPNVRYSRITTRHQSKLYNI